MNKRFNNLSLVTALKVTFIPVLTVLVAACSPVNFSTVQDNGTGVTTNTTPPPGGSCSVETIYRKTKIMFLVDTSDSNRVSTSNIINGVDTPTPASDPGKVFRGGAINNFFTTYQHKTNFNWSFSTFSNDAAQAYIGTNSNPLFSTSSTTMGTAIQQFMSTATDGGDTPYGAAIRLASRAIAIDPDLNSADQPNYFIVLLSDGFPTDYTDSHGNFMTAQMQSDVAALRAQAPGRVTLSTIYYASSNTQIPTAMSALQQIATAGGGQFAAVNTSSNTFAIDDVVSTQVCN